MLLATQRTHVLTKQPALAPPVAVAGPAVGAAAARAGRAVKLGQSACLMDSSSQSQVAEVSYD